MLIIKTLDTFYQVISIALLARAILSWVNTGYDNPAVGLVYRFTEPILMPARIIFEKYGLNRGIIDFSFLATIFGIQIIYTILRNILIQVLF